MTRPTRAIVPPHTSRYEALLPLASGGMGDVWIGRAAGAPGESSFVALKRALRGAEDANGAKEAITREAVLASQITHPNVVSVVDVDQTGDDQPVLVLAYVEGCTLANLFQRDVPHIDPRITTRILLDAACGLAAAHAKGIIHRDVTPSNVFVGLDGVARIGDFGVAKSTFEGRENTVTGTLKGKPAYMAPEYISGQRPSVLSDVFSLGVVAWEAYTSERLFKARTDLETLGRVLQLPIAAPSTRRPELAVLDPVLLRALARVPGERTSTIEQFARELEAVARAHALLATHVEVGAVVERIFGAQLENRRARLLTASMAVTRPIGEGRDYTATVSLPPPPPPARRRHEGRAQLHSRLFLATATALATTLAVMATNGARSLAAPRATPPAVVVAAPASEASITSPISTVGAIAPLAAPPTLSAPVVVITAPKQASATPRKAPPPAPSPPPPAAELIPKRAPPNPYAPAR